MFINGNVFNSVIQDLIRDLDVFWKIDAKIPAFAGMTECF